MVIVDLCFCMRVCCALTHGDKLCVYHVSCLVRCCESQDSV